MVQRGVGSRPRHGNTGPHRSSVWFQDPDKLQDEAAIVSVELSVFSFFSSDPRDRTGQWFVDM
jgi:hypothetical protein